MIALNTSNHELCRQWRRQMAAHCNPQLAAARKRFVALTFIDNANSSLRYANIDDLLLLVLYEDGVRSSRHPSLRLCGYGATRLPDGVRWGGAENCRLFKNLTLAPQRGARNERIDREKRDLLALALKLDRRLSRAARYPSLPWPELRLPRLWAGYRARHTGELVGAGPEFESACELQSVASAELFRSSTRRIDGLVAYPLDWVNSQMESAVAVFAELTLGIRRQICRVEKLPEGLIGFHGASAFDFYNSRFRNRSRIRRPWRRGARVKTATPERSSVRLQKAPAGVSVA
jgi:hypothetical protein